MPVKLTWRATNLAGQIDIIDVTNNAWTYPATSTSAEWPVIMRIGNGRWFGNAVDRQPRWQEITPYEALEWFKYSAPDLPIPKVLVSDLEEQDSVENGTTGKDDLGEFIRQRYRAKPEVKLRTIANEINDDGRWGSGWNDDRVSKQLKRYSESHPEIKIEWRKPRRNRQK